jgi:hypothetical protein
VAAGFLGRPRIAVFDGRGVLAGGRPHGHQHNGGAGEHDHIFSTLLGTWGGELCGLVESV